MFSCTASGGALCLLFLLRSTSTLTTGMDSAHLTDALPNTDPGPSSSLGLALSSTSHRPGKRKGSPSREDNNLPPEKRVRREVGAHASTGTPEAPGTQSVVAAIADTDTASVRDSEIIVVGRDYVVNNSIHGPFQVDVLEILNGLNLPNFRNIQLDTLAKATQGTCIWLTEGEILCIWIRKGKILWATGIPGAGKTVAASLVINHLEKLEAAKGGGICLAYVYIRYSEPLSIQDILLSFVKQIVERHPDIMPLVEALYATHKRERTKPTQDELVGLLSSFIQQGKEIFLVLEALDEFSAEYRRKLVDLLLSVGAKLFITSRPLHTLAQHFPHAHFFPIAAQPNDIDLLIKESIAQNAELEELIGHAGLEWQIASKIHQTSGGMFLHARLQLDALRRCSNAQQIYQTLEAFPSDIEAIYKRSWERIVHQDLAALVFLWVIYANGELTIEQLQHCVAVCPVTHSYSLERVVSAKFILSACCGLVNLDEQSDRVRLIHYTVKDTIQPLVLAKFPQPHAILATACITHLSTCGFQNSTFRSPDELSEALDFDPLLAYAHRSWAFHARQWSSLLGYIPQAVEAFVRKCTTYPVSIQLGESQEEIFDLLGPLHVAVYHSFEALLAQEAREHPYAMNAQTLLNGATPVPLHIASKLGSRESVRLLLGASGIDVNAREEAGVTPLMFAADGGHVEVVELLVDAPGIEVNAVDDRGVTALMDASIQGYPEVVQCLVEAPGINVHAVCNKGRTTLARASAQGNSASVALLLSAGASSDVNVADGHGETCLMLAAANKRTEAVKLLLRIPDIEVNAVDEKGRTALRHVHECSESRRLGVVSRTGYIHLSWGDVHGDHAADKAATIDILIDFWISHCTSK
ncbi:hypothetical protein BKA70DRAFT_1202173 [Coprinopsis sp. MPI-PUGE-AT-0042]|nr:hypothetical protein BKA70DRAFT_1202173 [Coprinopsis sp. MPI-PUGE-AT-0042]